MTMEEKIARINELYHKSKETGLTEEEKEEQGRLCQLSILTEPLKRLRRQILSKINKYMVAKKIRFCNG